MKSYFYNALEYIVKLESKIAFYPSLLSLVGLMFAFFMFYLESKGISGYLVENAPVLVVNDTETARSLLTTFIGGLISIMVFSFSLVMILLNQASSNFTPRVLPGLISNRRHQVILGIYNATLLYCIFTLVSIEPHGNEYQLPGFSVLLGIVLMTLCLGAFIYFIHSISQEIQVNNIMDRIFETAKNRLQKLIDTEKNTKVEFPDTSKWDALLAHKSGYFEDVSLNALAEIAKEDDLKFEIVPLKGVYILKGLPLIRYKGKLTDEQQKLVLSLFHFSKSELVEDNYVLAFKQITEIAIKAMSPGINDPGTAINAIDYLTELFAIRMEKQDQSYFLDENDNAILYINTVSFKDLLFNVMAPLRAYCKHDIIIVQKLFLMLEFLLGNRVVEVDNYNDVIKQEIENLYEDALIAQTNKADLKSIEARYENL